MLAHDDGRAPAAKKPKFANFTPCDIPNCDGLCYNYHAHQDTKPVLLSEIESVVCGERCLEEYCTVPSCRCFYKLQAEIFKCREAQKKMSEKGKKKCAYLQAQISVLRESKTNEKQPSIPEEIRRITTRHFALITNLEKEIKQDFCQILDVATEENKQMKSQVEIMKKEKEELLAKYSSLANENLALTKMFPKVQRDLRPSLAIG